MATKVESTSQMLRSGGAGTKIPVRAAAARTATMPHSVSPVPGVAADLRSQGRQRRLRKVSLAAPVSRTTLPDTRLQAPPEDGLAGANAARNTPLLATGSNQDCSKPEMMAVSVRASLQPRVYLEGMEYMKGRIREVLDELDRIQCQYHRTSEISEDHFVDFLKICDRHFLRANTQLRKHSIKLEVIDSENRLVALLNQLRELEDTEQETVKYLTEYWENVKSTVERLKAVIGKFQTNVLSRLKKNYISYNSGDTHLEVCSSYSEDISSHVTETESVLSNTQILLKSFHSGIYQNLYGSSRFVDMVLVSCDLKAFPILRLVADVVLKVTHLCDIAHLWLARDEQFMHEIHNFIRETRHMTRQREHDLKCEKEKQKKYAKNLKATNILLQNNRDKLQKIEAELQELERQMNENERDKEQRHHQLLQKESMVDFLKITLAQTKRNYSLQTKRSKLSKQVTDLKELLSSMERDLESIQCEIQVKAEEKVRLSEKVEYGERSYEALRGDMARFSSSLQQLESEVTDLTAQLLQLEIIHNLKTSPEKVEEIYDRPSTVKLAPSLKEKIMERKRKYNPK